MSEEYSYSSVQVTNISSTTTITKVQTNLKEKKTRKKWSPFKCRLSKKCNQRFSDLLDLRNHLKTHISYDLKDKSESTHPIYCKSTISGDQFVDTDVDYWMTKNIEVSFKCSDKRGVLKDIFGSVGSILLNEENIVVTTMLRHLEPVVPTPTDEIKVIFGEYREKTGNLLSIDGNKGVVILEDTKELQILPLKDLCKLIRE